MKTLIIANNVVNDFCSAEKDFLDKSVSIGFSEIERLFDVENKYGLGPFAKFLIDQNNKSNIIFSRNSYHKDNPLHKEYLDRMGEYCIEGSLGIQFPEFLISTVRDNHILNILDLGLTYSDLRNFIKEWYDFDLFKEPEKLSELKVLLVGFHTERGILANALGLKNLFGIKNIAVFSHFLSSSNKEGHYTSLRYQFPDSFTAFRLAGAM